MNYIKAAVMAVILLLSACTDESTEKETDNDKVKAEQQQSAKSDASQDSLQQDDYPAPIKSIIAQGVEIIDTFEAPAGMTGYAGMVRGQPLAIYVTEDKQHAVVGTLVDAEGVNLTADVMERLVEGPRNQRAWAELEDSAWIADGSDDAPVIIYTFTDTNCPYCHKFREAADPWIQAGKVQFRHILVAILRQSSMDKGATILGSEDSEAMMQQHQKLFSQGGVEVDQEAVENGKVRVQLNTNLMRRLGYSATPTSFYKDQNGKIKAIQGMPQGDALQQMMGSSKPE